MYFTNEGLAVVFQDRLSRVGNPSGYESALQISLGENLHVSMRWRGVWVVPWMYGACAIGPTSTCTHKREGHCHEGAF